MFRLLTSIRPGAVQGTAAVFLVAFVIPSCSTSSQLTLECAHPRHLFVLTAWSTC